MKNPVFFVLALLTLFISGCVGKMPQTAEEFRLALPGAFMGKTETSEVNRPFEEVAKTFEKMAPKCLDKTVKVTSSTPGKYGPVTSVMVTDYNPTVLVTKEKAELHLQEKVKGTLKVYEEPEKGYYSMVVDATPAGANKTRLDFYYPSRGKDVIVKAIKGWASGKNTGCPDLAKIDRYKINDENLKPYVNAVYYCTGAGIRAPLWLFGDKNLPKYTGQQFSYKDRDRFRFHVFKGAYGSRHIPGRQRLQNVLRRDCPAKEPLRRRWYPFRSSKLPVFRICKFRVSFKLLKQDII